MEEPLVRLGPAAFQRVAEQDRRSPSRLHELAFVRAIFRRLNRKALAGLALHRETQNAGSVLAEEDVEDARTGRHDLFRREDLLLAERRPKLFFELGRGRTCHRDRRPVPVVESGLVPARQFQAGIVVLAAVNVAEGDGAARALPACIRHQAGVPAIGVSMSASTHRRKGGPKSVSAPFLWYLPWGAGGLNQKELPSITPRTLVPLRNSGVMSSSSK